MHTRGSLPEESGKPTECCSTGLQGCLVQRKCKDSGVLLCTHMGLSLLERVGSEQNAVVPARRTAQYRETMEIVGHCYTRKCGCAAQGTCGVGGTLRCSHTWLPCRMRKVLLFADHAGATHSCGQEGKAAERGERAGLGGGGDSHTQSGPAHTLLFQWVIKVRARTRGCLWSERSVAECTRSCTTQGNRASRVLRCVHTSLPQGGRRELVGPE